MESAVLHFSRRCATPFPDVDFQVVFCGLSGGVFCGLVFFLGGSGGCLGAFWCLFGGFCVVFF